MSYNTTYKFDSQFQCYLEKKSEKNLSWISYCSMLNLLFHLSLYFSSMKKHSDRGYDFSIIINIIIHSLLTEIYFIIVMWFIKSVQIILKFTKENNNTQFWISNATEILIMLVSFAYLFNFKSNLSLHSMPLVYISCHYKWVDTYTKIQLKLLQCFSTISCIPINNLLFANVSCIVYNSMLQNVKQSHSFLSFT